MIECIEGEDVLCPDVLMPSMDCYQVQAATEEEYKSRSDIPVMLRLNLIRFLLFLPRYC